MGDKIRKARRLVFQGLKGYLSAVLVLSGGAGAVAWIKGCNETNEIEKGTFKEVASFKANPPDIHNGLLTHGKISPALSSAASRLYTSELNKPSGGQDKFGDAYAKVTDGENTVFVKTAQTSVVFNNAICINNAESSMVAYYAPPSIMKSEADKRFVVTDKLRVRDENCAQAFGIEPSYQIKTFDLNGKPLPSPPAKAASQKSIGAKP